MFLITLLIVIAVTRWDKPDSVLVQPATPNSRMMRESLLNQIDDDYQIWRARYQEIDSPDDLKKYKADKRDLFQQLIGPFPRHVLLCSQSWEKQLLSTVSAFKKSYWKLVPSFI
ncbi:MAG: hypothetical protein R3C11_03290 [Planctomycetaceae bacterium]